VNFDFQVALANQRRNYQDLLPVTSTRSHHTTDTFPRIDGFVYRAGEAARMNTVVKKDGRKRVIAESVRGARAQFLLAQSPIGIFLSPLGGLALSRALEGDADPTRLTIWFGGLVLLAFPRLYAWSQCPRHDTVVSGPPVWDRLWSATMITVALWWGIGGVLILPGSESGRLLVFCSLMIMGGGTCAIYAIHSTPTAIAVLSITLPISLNFMFVQEATLLRAMGVSALLYQVGSLHGILTLKHFLVRSHELTYDLEENVALLKRSEEMRKDLSLMLVHDLRTPLSALITHAQLAREYSDEGDTKETREAIVQTQDLSQSLVRMVNSILDVNRLESDQFPISKCRIALGRVVEHSLDGLGHLSEQVEVKGSDEGGLICDPDLICRVLMNLLSNALRYQPPDETVKLFVRRYDDELEFRVVDKGPGVPPEEQTRIFDKYAQASRQSRGYTSGLGLTFCRMAVEKHGGTIGLHSQPGEGSEFWFRLPGSGS
jgi:signal transduction histidine kinase